MISNAFAQSVPGPSDAAPIAGTSYVAPSQEATTASHKGFDWMGILPMALIFVVFYFFMIRPQQKKMKQQREMLSQIKVGDHVVTTGGFLGVIDQISGEHDLLLKVAEGVSIRILRSSISEVTPRGGVAKAAEVSGSSPVKKSEKPKSEKSKAVSSKKVD